MPDSVLTRIAQGDVTAVRECIDQFGGLVWSIARRFTRTRADAEDAVQDIFTDIWRSAGRYDATQGSERVFITTIARRRLIDRMRRQAQFATTDSAELSDTLQWSDRGESGEISVEAAGALRAVGQLKPEQRKVLELALLHGMSQSEIADSLGMPLGTVKTQVRRGLIRVRQLMGLDAVRADDEEVAS